MFVAPLLVLGACSDDDGVTVQGPPPPAATVRLVNAIADTGAVSLRFIDRVENLPTLQGVAFRASSGMFQRTETGSRATRLFPSADAPNAPIGLVSQILIDTNINLAANRRYTFAYTGRASAAAPAAERHELLVIDEDPTPPTPPANSIALRVLHLAVGTGAVDVYIVPVTSATAATPADFATVNAGVIRNVAYKAQSAYANVPVRTSTAGHLYRFVVTAAGSTTALFAVTPNQPGTPAPAAGSAGHGTVGAQPGFQIAGSVFTVVAAPGAVVNSRSCTVSAGVCTNSTPSAFLLVDRVLNP